MPAPLSDAWPRAPIEGVTPLLQPIAHVLVHARSEIPTILASVTPDSLWIEPGGVPSIGFHLTHLAGSIERLFAHASGRPLTTMERQQLALEGSASRQRPTSAELLGRLDMVLEVAMSHLRMLPPERLLETRDISPDGAFATVFDLLSSAAEHTSRHQGQIVTTAAFLRAFGPP